MPVTLNPEHYDLWLDPGFRRLDALKEMLNPVNALLATLVHRGGPRTSLPYPKQKRGPPLGVWAALVRLPRSLPLRFLREAEARLGDLKCIVQTTEVKSVSHHPWRSTCSLGQRLSAGIVGGITFRVGVFSRRIVRGKCTGVCQPTEIRVVGSVGFPEGFLA
jgi:hypothetical protein